MASPNIEGTSNPTATGGSTMGVVVGSKTSETVGFYGSAGQTQAAAISVPTLSGTYASDYAALQTYITAVAAVLHGTGLSA